MDGCQNRKVAEGPLQRGPDSSVLQLHKSKLRHSSLDLAAGQSVHALATTNAVTCSGHRTCMMRRYQRKWPNCANIKCFSGVNLELAKAFCLSRSDCDGFS